MEEDFRGLLQPKILQLRDDFDGVTCRHYGIQHKHDFLRTLDHHVRKDFTDQIEVAVSKYDCRLANLRRDAAKGSVLFVRYDDTLVFETHAENVEKTYRNANEQDADDILMALRRLYPAADVTLLALNFDTDQPGDPSLIVGGDAIDYGDRSSSDYAGSDAGWNELLNELNIVDPCRDQTPTDGRSDISSVETGYW